MNGCTKEELDRIIRKKQIRTVFQPIISIRDGSILGHEALSRITCESIFTSPDMLFTAAEEHNRLWDLELLCRTTALEAAYIYMIPPYNKKLFLNVNPNIMLDDNYKQGFTKDFLKQYQITPDNLIFEITERNVIKDMVGFCTTISHYKNLGCLIAIDDAGAGYSGLNLISDVCPNYLKLDMQLIRDIDKDSLKHALVKGMVEFSKASNVTLIAEGIESALELETLVNLGVPYGQGYFIQIPSTELAVISPDVMQAIKEINARKNEHLRDSFLNTTIRGLCSTTATISPADMVFEVYDRMNKSPNSVGFCVVDNNIPVGIITKEKLALKLSGRYGYTLNQYKPISVLMDRCFLSVDSKTPVNVVSAAAMARSNENLYDFIVVTKLGQYIGTVTIKDLLEKCIEIEVSEAKQQNPLSGLPGNLMVEQKIKQHLENDQKYSIAYFDIDNFKAYNDNYGFERGDMIIKLLADILRRCIPHSQFVGHIGGDDFVVILNEQVDEEYYSKIVKEFETDVLAYYNETDIHNGYILATNRCGVTEQFPLITLTVVVVNNRLRAYHSTFEVSSVLAGLKISAKRNKHMDLKKRIG